MANEITGPLGSDPLNLGGGYGYLPYVNQNNQLLSALYLGQGSLGQSLLDTLVKLRTDPAAGPLGLAATGLYGNAQGRASATGGAGIKSPYADDFDRLLQGMLSGVMTKGSVFNPDNHGQINTDSTTFNNPTQAPAPSPAAAAAAPNQAPDWIRAWEAYNPGKQWSGANPLPTGGAENDPAKAMIRAWEAYHPGQQWGVPGYAYGGTVGSGLDSVTHAYDQDPVAANRFFTEASKNPEGVQRMFGPQQAPAASRSALEDAINGVQGNDRLKQALRMGANLEGGGWDNWATGDGGAAYGPYQIHPELHGMTPEQAQDPAYATNYMSQLYNDAMSQVPDELWQTDPAQAAALTAFHAERPAQMYDPNQVKNIWQMLLNSGYNNYAGGGTFSMKGGSVFNGAGLPEALRALPKQPIRRPMSTSTLTVPISTGPRPVFGTPPVNWMTMLKSLKLPGYQDGGVHPTSAPAAAPAPEEPDPYEKYGGKDMMGILKSYVSKGGDPHKFVGVVRDLADVHDKVTKGEIPESTPDGGYPGRPQPDMNLLAPHYIRSLAMMLRPAAGAMHGMPGFKKGGGMTIGGQPHFIVDAQGNKVAALTEDGAPEHLSGVGGVEVTPLLPERRAAYERRKKFGAVLGAAEADLAARTGRLPGSAPGIPGAATGASLLFNKAAGVAPGSSVTPANAGGAGNPAMQMPTRDQAVGSYFKSSYDPKTMQFTLPGGADDIERYSKLLGGALSATNQAIDPGILSALNAGKLPDKVLNAAQLGSLSPSQRAGYLALLQQGGLGSPEDILDLIKKFTPDALN